MAQLQPPVQAGDEPERQYFEEESRRGKGKRLRDDRATAQEVSASPGSMRRNSL
jgi:hypothetical protein